MTVKKSKPYLVPQIITNFSLSDICGTWLSLCGSPTLKIYYDGSRFWLQFSYKHDTAFTIPLSQCWGITFFYFYGMIEIIYDDEQDILRLTTEGTYKRLYE